MTPWQLQVFNVSVRKKEKWLWAEKRIKEVLTPTSRCLDIGSGVGTLSILQERLGGTWEFTETDEGAALETQKIVSGNVYTIDIFDSKLQPSTYDLITIFDVIEHVPDPVVFIARAKELLREGGTIVLTTPADDGSYYFWRRLADSWFGIDKDAHGHVVEGFSKPQLAEIASKNMLHLKEASQFSFFFTEFVELMYNGAYILKNKKKQGTKGYNLSLSPASGQDVSRHQGQLAILKTVYPILRGISLLDHVLPVSKGYEWGVVLTSEFSDKA